MPTCAFISFRLGGTDGVSVAASAWMHSFRSLGYDISTVAGEGPVDHLIPGLAIGASEPPNPDVLSRALSESELVVVENLLTIPMNPDASKTVAEVLRGRPAILHHHDPPWQRARYLNITARLPDDPLWMHVTINNLTRHQFKDRGIEATTIYNGFDTDVCVGDRESTRNALDVTTNELLVLHPVRAISRKNIPTAISYCENLGGTYWLTGPAEENFDRELAHILSNAGCRVIHQSVDHQADMYAAADMVIFPSKWEGFGNPPVEASLHRRPVAVGNYPVATELRNLGFRWFDPLDLNQARAWFADPDPELLDHNRSVVETHLSQTKMTRDVENLLSKAGWLP